LDIFLQFNTVENKVQFFHYLTDAYFVSLGDRLKISFVESIGVYTRYIPELLKYKKQSIISLDPDGKIKFLF
jgi:hypothetical protein